MSVPTTSPLSFASYIQSGTHPALVSTLTARRAVLRGELKAYSRSASSAVTLQTALEEYIPHLLTLEAALSGRPVAGEYVEVTLLREVQVTWRSKNRGQKKAAVGRGRRAGKRTVGLDGEICHVLSALAWVQAERGASQLKEESSSVEQRTAGIQQAARHFSTASGISRNLAGRCARQTCETTHSAMTALYHAQMTLLSVAKDDPYPALAVRGPDDREWMYKAPEMPKVRAHLCARLCLSAAEHANKAVALLSDASASSSGVNFARDLSRAARARACRLLGLDADLAGRAGEAIAWLRAGKGELGLGSGTDSSEESGWKGWKSKWTERRDTKKLKDAEEASPCVEEARVIFMLEEKWVKINDTINTQLIPPSGPLLARMPSGRDLPAPPSYIPPTLDERALASLRGPVDPNVRDEGSESGSRDSDGSDDEAKMPGGFANSAYY